MDKELIKSNDDLICPKCGSDDIYTETLGCPDGYNSNRASCCKCKWKGTAQDWIDLFNLKKIKMINGDNINTKGYGNPLEIPKYIKQPKYFYDAVKDRSMAYGEWGDELWLFLWDVNQGNWISYRKANKEDIKALEKY